MKCIIADKLIEKYEMLNNKEYIKMLNDYKENDKHLDIFDDILINIKINIDKPFWLISLHHTNNRNK